MGAGRVEQVLRAGMPPAAKLVCQVVHGSKQDRLRHLLEALHGL